MQYDYASGTHPEQEAELLRSWKLWVHQCGHGRRDTLTSSGVRRPIACAGYLVYVITREEYRLRTESSVDKVASTIADFFSCNCWRQVSWELLRNLCKSCYLNYATLNAVFDNKLNSVYRTMLAQAMDSVHCLCGDVRNCTGLLGYLLTIFDLGETNVRLSK